MTSHGDNTMPMTGRDRKAELVRRGITMTSIAIDLDVTASHVQAVVAGNRRSPRVEEAIAAAIERPVDEVFEPAPNGAAA